MRLSSLFIHGNQSYIEGSGKEDSSAALKQSLLNGMEEISAKVPGQSVTGEVVERNGNDVLIAIGKNQMLRAKLDAGIPVEEGQLMTFTVKNTGGSKVVLSPLYANTGNDPNISRALQMAGIPENDVSVNMVRTMMQEGMSIDRDSLNQMMRTIHLNPEANVETVVQLSRLNIPVTENNIFQMEAYKNYEHQIAEGILEIVDALTDTVAEMTAAKDTQGVISLYSEVISMLAEAGGNEEAAIPETEAKLPVSEEPAVLEELPGGKESQAGEELQLSEGLPGRSGLTGKELLTLSKDLTQAGLPESIVKSFASGEITVNEMLNRLNELLLSENLTSGQREGISKLLSGSEFHQLIKNQMKEKWMITPEEVSEQNKVENLYERLNSQMNRLNHALEQAARADTPLGKAVSNLAGNIDFMNQMNQMFTYVQLPLKLQGQDTTGELYVYTNKKNLAKKDGEVSALLHLDMEHLGSVDVHVAMIDNKVSTRFYLRDDSVLDFIAEHIDILNERLNKRGYSMTASFIKKGEEEESNVMEEILKQDKNISVLSGYSFDARA